MRVLLYAKKVLKETETEKTIVFFVKFLSLVAFQLGRARAPCPPGYAYASDPQSFGPLGAPPPDPRL